MMEFVYNRDRDELINVMKSKAEKKNISVVTYSNKAQISLDSEKYKDESIVPVSFKGKFSETDNGCTLKGKYVYGFYLYTLVIVAAFLIVARFVASVIQNQADNMIMCGIVTVLLIVVICIVNVKSKPAKKILDEFLNDLDKKVNRK